MSYNRFLGILITIVFLIVFFSCSYFLLKDYFELKENDDANQNLIEETIEIQEETHKKIIDWDYLKAVNEDIIGWIEIENTSINYPILKDNNLFYLKHSYDKKYNSSGSIFTTNTNPFEDSETIIYGHNMKNGSMFSLLGKYLNEDFLYAHQHFKIYTSNGNYEATVFSAYSIAFETENSNIKQLDINERIKYYQKASKCKVSNVEISNKIIKLSTCSYINAKYTPTEQRYYIIASIIPIE